MPNLRSLAILLPGAVLALLPTSLCHAQIEAAPRVAVAWNDLSLSSARLSSSAELPDSPGFSQPVPGSSDPILFGQAQGAAVPAQIAPRYKRTVQTGQTVLPLSSGDKIVLAARQRVSPVGFVSTLFSAGYAHLTDSRPHFGTDSAGFGERLGGAELRQTVQSLLTYGVYASAFHDDPRYYVLGRNYSVRKRVVYAAERVVITRKDNGHSAINWPQLAGVATAQAFANSYYPSRDQSVRRTVSSTFSSYATSALTNQINEFLGDVASHFRHKPKP